MHGTIYRVSERNRLSRRRRGEQRREWLAVLDPVVANAGLFLLPIDNQHDGVGIEDEAGPAVMVTTNNRNEAFR